MTQPRRDSSFGDGEGGAHVIVIHQIEPDAASMVAVERLEHDREADAPGRLHGAGLGAAGLLLRHRQAGRAEQFDRHVLIGGQVDGQGAGLGGHRGADALGIDALTELDQGRGVEPDDRGCRG